MSIERVVALLTPVFAAGAGLLTGEIGHLMPGVSLSQSDLTVLFVTGATAALSAALKWLHGRQTFMKVETDVEQLAAEVAAKVKANAPASIALGDLEYQLKAHEAAIVDAISKAVHAPPSAEQVVQQIAQQLVAAHSA